MPNIVVLGSGMAGFGAAYRLHAEGIKPVMYDKNDYLRRPYGVVSLETGLSLRRGPAHFVYKGSANPGTFRRKRRSALRDCSDQFE